MADPNSSQNKIIEEGFWDLINSTTSFALPSAQEKSALFVSQ
jgi:hypothetical protein